MEALPLVGLLVILLILSAFFSSSETALFSLQALDREKLRQEHEGRADRVERLLEEPTRTLAAVLAGNELVNISLATVCATLVMEVIHGPAWVNLIVATPLLIVLGEVLPKTLALRFSRRWATFISKPLGLWIVVTSPLRWGLLHLAGLFTRALGVRPGAAGERGGLEEDDFRRLIDQGHDAGSIREVEQDLIHRVLEFDDLPISRLMTPRPDVISVALNTPWPQLLALVRERRMSRLPVYHRRPDNVIGVLLIKDLLRFQGGPPPGPTQLRAILQTPLFVPTSKPADDLLHQFRERRVHMALVVDEHGSITGLVTMDDLLQELVGELGEEDEDDSEEISRIHPDTWTVSGAADVGDFEEETGIVLPAGDYHTLAGFVFSELGHLPKVGEAVLHDNIRFTVSQLTDRRITELKVKVLAASQRILTEDGGP